MLRSLACFNCKRVDENNWIVPKGAISLLEKNFTIESVTVPWEEIGQTMKLSPYDYQKETVHFGVNNGSSLFLLPTGAGKSCTAIALYLELKLSNKVSTPGIIVVPASLKYQWVKEVSKFSDLVAHSIDTPSKMKKKFDAQFEDCDLMICNYETLKNKTVSEKLLDMNLEFMIIDEVQCLGNYKSGRSKAIYQFNDLPYRYGMTATPITRDPSNLFGIFNFIDTELFKTHGKFATNYLIYRSYGQVSGVKNVDHLKAKIAPYIFMKSEEEIASQLPEIIITPMYCQMDNKLDHPVSKDVLAESGFDYVALGHIHRPEEPARMGKTLVSYCGFPEGRGFDELGFGGALEVVIDRSANTVSADRVTLSSRRYMIETVDVTGASSSRDVVSAVERFVSESGFGKETSLRIVLTGAVSPDTSFDITADAEALGLSVLEIENNTSPVYDAQLLESDISLRGALYRQLLPALRSADSRERAVASEALRIGLAALDGKQIL